MKELPIIFSGPMVRAILDGTKTQTRRVMKKQPNETAIASWQLRDGSWGWRYPGGYAGPAQSCPYGAPGGRLWVRETCRAEELGEDPSTYPQHIIDRYVDEANGAAGLDGVRYAADDAFIEIKNSEAAAERWMKMRHYRRPREIDEPSPWVPPIHMPKWACRIWLEVTGVRVEQVQDISRHDAMAEGIRKVTDGLYHYYRVEEWDGRSPAGYSTASAAHRELWDSIHGAGAWERNDWVWVVELRRKGK